MSESEKKLQKQLMMGLAGIAATIITYQIYKRLYADKNGLPGPKPRNKESGNFVDMGSAGSLHEYLQELTNKYGPIGAFWWGSTRVAYITSQKILLNEENKKLFANLSDRPPFLFDGFKPMIGKDSIQYCNGTEFKLRYHDVYLATYQTKMVTKIPIMAKLAQKHITSWSDAIQKNNGKVVDIDISKEGMAFSSKSVIYASFGSDISEKLCDTIVEGYNGAWNEMEKRLVAGIPSDAKRDAQFQSDLNKMKETVSIILKKSNTSNKNENSFLNCIATQNKVYNTQEKILAEAITAIVGGTHTTGMGLAWLFNYIARDFKVQQKMFDEIKHFFNVNGDIDTMDAKTISDKLKRLMYCRQVVTESLRLSSLAPWAARVNYNEDMMINACDGKNTKIKIPKGMAFIIGQGVALKDENVFKNGNVFNPDRWNRRNLKQNKILQQSQDAIFGGLGNRMCPGWSFFRTEALIFIVAAVSKFKFEIKNDAPMDTAYGLVAHPKHNVVIKVSKR